MKKSAGQSKTTRQSKAEQQRQSKAEQQSLLNFAQQFDKIYFGLLYLYAKRKFGGT